MKSALIFLIGLSLIFTGGAVSYALPFSDTVDFSGSGTSDGRTYLEIGNNSSLFIYPYTHDVTFSPPADSITSAEIILSHRGNSNTTNGELWLLYEGTSTLIGQLDNSLIGDNWVDQHFTLPSSLYGAISGGSWSLQLSLQETTPGSDKLQVDQSVLLGEYNPRSDQGPDPVPESSTLLLLGSGLLGLAGLSKRFKK